MNFKLKGIEIDVFRVYQDNQMFNFLTNTGEIANLVVIYAPNGYGKTSFVEAVEWALTGDIKRISKNSIIRNTADIEKGVILKNRKSNKEFGTVKLITDNGDILQKRTKIVGRYGRKTDFIDGDIVIKSDSFNNLNLLDYGTRFILGQDKIDAFLRSSTPRERYDILTEFWDDKNDSLLFKNILGMHNESEKKLQETKRLLEDTKNEIKSIIIRPNIIEEVNTLVKKFNEISINNLVLPEFEKNNNQQFINVLIEIQTKLELYSNIIKGNFEKSGYLVINYKAFILKNKELTVVQESIKNKKLIINKFKIKDETINNLNILLQDFYALYNNYKKLKRLEKEYKKYKIIDQKLIFLEGINRELIKNISDLSKLKNQENEKKIEFQYDLEKFEKAKIDLEKQLSELDINLKNFSTSKNKEEHFSKRIAQIQDLVNIRLRKIQQLENKMLFYKSYTKYDIKNIVKLDIKDQKTASIINELIVVYNIKNQKEQRLKQVEHEYIQFGELNDQLNTIYKIGKKYIENTLSCTCPLCKSKFKDFNTLIENVDQEIKDIDSINRIKFEMEEIKDAIKKEELNIENLLTRFNEKLEEKLANILLHIRENQEKVNSYEILKQKINRKLTIVKQDQIDLNNFFSKINIDIKNKYKDYDYLENIKKDMILNINNYTNKISDCLNKIIDANENQKDFSKRLNIIENKIISNKNKIREFNEEPLLKSFNQLLEELKINDEINTIKSEKQKVRQEILAKIKNKRELKNIIEMLSDELKLINKPDLLEELNQEEQQKKEVESSIYDYKKRVNEILDKDSYTEEDIIQCHERISKDKKTIQNGVSILNELINYSKYIEDNIASNIKKSKKGELEEKIEILEKANMELSNLKEIVINYIEDKINSAFNLDSINSIYQRIDPHPNLNNIKFETDFTKDKPELQIYASNKKEKLAPILYFSAAQVNILSLSIFLARALIVEQDGLNTIFMDDPIQHLDNLNILSFIDLLRTITVTLDKQVILSTHNVNFYKLLKRKMDPKYTSSKFIELESFGKVK